jgi:ubiquinone/menaquinone biosynthesis C-methylase UbiE
MTGMEQEKLRVCPVERAGGLDLRIRRWAQNPTKILSPYIKEGMTALDVGCGPGFFTLDMARLVGESGRVIAADLQEGMLQIVRDKITASDLEPRITLHKSSGDRIGVNPGVDFVLAFYMLHEVPDQDAFFVEVCSILKAGGLALVVEPPFHVSKTAFEQSISKAEDVGFEIVEQPKVLFSKAVILKKK